MLQLINYIFISRFHVLIMSQLLLNIIEKWVVNRSGPFIHSNSFSLPGLKLKRSIEASPAQVFPPREAWETFAGSRWRILLSPVDLQRINPQRQLLSHKSQDPSAQTHLWAVAAVAAVGWIIAERRLVLRGRMSRFNIKRWRHVSRFGWNEMNVIGAFFFF